VRRVLHLVRAGAAPLVVAADDWVVYLEPMRLAQGGSLAAAPLPFGPFGPLDPLDPLDHDQVIALVAAADLVVTW